MPAPSVLAYTTAVTTTAAAAAIVASHERLAPIVYSATISGSGNGTSTGARIEATTITASTANGHRRRSSSGGVGARPTTSPAAVRPWSIPLATAIAAVGMPTISMASTSTTRAGGLPNHERRAGNTRSAYPRGPVPRRSDLADLGLPRAEADRDGGPADRHGDRGAQGELHAAVDGHVADPVDRDGRDALAQVAEEADRGQQRLDGQEEREQDADQRAARADHGGQADGHRAAERTGGQEPGRTRDERGRAGRGGGPGEGDGKAAQRNCCDGDDREHDRPRAGHARAEQRRARAAGGGEVAEHAGLDVLRPGS